MTVATAPAGISTAGDVAPRRDDTVLILPCVSALVTEAWEHIEPFVEKAAAKSAGEFDAEFAKAACMTAAAQLWLICRGKDLPHAFVMTRMVEHPACMSCDIWLAGGSDSDGWKDEFLAHIEPWSKARGCSLVNVYGRHGWSRKLAPNGYKTAYVTYRKAI